MRLTSADMFTPLHVSTCSFAYTHENAYATPLMHRQIDMLSLGADASIYIHMHMVAYARMCTHAIIYRSVVYAYVYMANVTHYFEYRLAALQIYVYVYARACAQANTCT